jgi:enolase-phosphatase E1
MIQNIVTDIEGTTSSLSFVKDVLFPYARAHLAAYVRTHEQDARVAPLLDDVRKEAGHALSTDAVIEQLLQWIDEDRKITPLKTLQGMIWETGYRQGDFKGHVYDDAVRNLRRWKDQGRRLYVYSSGSVYAQKLLFGYSDYGDLTPLFSGYFDTTVGMKRDPASYTRIVETLRAPAASILFLSDIVEELDAARTAGMHTAWLVRAGDTTATASHPQARDFDTVDAQLRRL